MRPSELRTAIVGCGQVAGAYDELSNDGGVYSHAGAYRAKGVPVTWAVEPGGKRLEEFRDYWKVENISTELSALADAGELDIVSVCTPDPTHYQVCKTILETNPPKILWAEKPLASTWEQAHELVELARAKGTGMRVTYHRRWEPGHARIREMIQGGKLGRVTTATGYHVKGLIHIGTTIIDTMRYLLGEVKDAWRIPIEPRGSFPNDPSQVMTMLMDNGCLATVAGVDGDEYTYSLFEIDIIGTKGRIRILENGDRYELYELVPYGHYEGFNELKLTGTHETDMGQAMRYGLEMMLDALGNGTWNDLSEGENAARDIEIVHRSRPVEM